jgi:hypothetical protein
MGACLFNMWKICAGAANAILREAKPRRALRIFDIAESIHRNSEKIRKAKAVPPQIHSAKR